MCLRACLLRKIKKYKEDFTVSNNVTIGYRMKYEEI
jgi:hypothetical protein